MSFLFDQNSLDEAPQKLREIHAYWDELRGESPGPSFRKFDLLRIPTDLIPHTIVVDYISESDDFNFRFFGTEVRNRHGQEMTGKSPKDFNWSPFGKALIEEYRAFMKRGQAENLSFGFTNEKGLKELHKVLRLPLSEDGENVTGMIVVLMTSTEDQESQDFF